MLHLYVNYVTFQICTDITKIIHFMATTPYGTMAMNDFRRQQFVLVDGTLKVSDVDDVGFGDPSCDSDDVCTIHFSSANFTQRSVKLSQTVKLCVQRKEILPLCLTRNSRFYHNVIVSFSYCIF